MGVWRARQGPRSKKSLRTANVTQLPGTIILPLQWMLKKHSQCNKQKSTVRMPAGAIIMTQWTQHFWGICQIKTAGHRRTPWQCPLVSGGFLADPLKLVTRYTVINWLHDVLELKKTYRPIVVIFQRFPVVIYSVMRCPAVFRQTKHFWVKYN